MLLTMCAADTKVTKIYNVMAAIPGHIKDEVVMVGNHRDGDIVYLFETATYSNIEIIAWVMGASDPTSGTASMHEVIRGFGVLLKQGWKPLRTIVFASWDAEEVRHSLRKFRGSHIHVQCSTVLLGVQNTVKTLVIGYPLMSCHT